MKHERGHHLPPKKTKRRLSKWGNSHYVGFLEADPMVEANSKCPKCAQGTMKLIPSPEQLAPKLPEQNRLTAECDNCSHKDEVKVVATDE
jgi:hypothetical protein